MPKYPFDLIIVDLETAGDPDHRILEIGAVRLNDRLEIQDTYHSLVNGSPIDEKVIKIHGITEEMVAGAPDWGEAYAPWVEWCQRSPVYILSAFGAYFDIPVLRAEYRRFGLKFPHPGQCIDVKTIIWDKVIEMGYPAHRLGVDRALEIFGLKFEGQRHRALPDALMETKLFLEAKKR